jgi:predicted Zn-dependent protease
LNRAVEGFVERFTRPALTMQEQKALADSVLSQKSSAKSQGRIDDVWAYVDRLLDQADTTEALTYVATALPRDSLRLQYQQLYAEHLYARGDRANGVERAELVAAHSEQDVLINRAHSVIGLAPIAVPQPPVSRSTNGYTLVLVPIGEVDYWLLWQLADRLEQGLAIPVLVQQTGVIVPPPARDPLAEAAREFRPAVLAYLEDNPGSVELEALNLTMAKLQNDTLVLQAAQIMLKEQGGAVLAGAMKLILEAAASQWNITELIEALELSILYEMKPRTVYLGVTRLDAFYLDWGFTFGAANKLGGGIGSISYHRFTADFSGTVDSRPLLLQRTYKQALSTTGFMLGVPRCKSATCARAYPNSLEEHDAKSDTLCKACTMGFERALGVKMARRM